MYCPQCGHSNEDEYAFCQKCGASLKRGGDPEPDVASGSPTAAPAPHAGPYGSSLVAPAATGQATEYAGFWWRFLAVFIDGILVTVVSNIIVFTIAIMVGITAAAAGASEDIISTLAGLFGFFFGIAIAWLYEAGMVSSRYQATLGKVAVGIVVTDMSGARITFARATGRHFGKILSSLTLLIGYLIQPFTERRQALHDMLAGCLVLRKLTRPSTV